MSQKTCDLLEDGCRKNRNDPGESMVCWRDNAARGLVTLFCRNHGNEILRRLFCDFVGTKPWAVPPPPLPPPPPPLLIFLFRRVCAFFTRFHLSNLRKIRTHAVSQAKFALTVTAAQFLNLFLFCFVFQSLDTWQRDDLFRFPRSLLQPTRKDAAKCFSSISMDERMWATAMAHTQRFN